MPTMSARYTVIDGEVIAQERSGVRHQLVPDPLGSTVALYNDAGTKIDTFQYWPYGESAGRTGTTVAKFQYVGAYGYYTDGTGRNYVRARYLSSSRGRWVTLDPADFVNDLNLYRYVTNNPEKYMDMSGKQKQSSPPPPPFWDWQGPHPNHTNYCGAGSKCPPEGKGNTTYSVDCIDRACAEHDRCLYRLLPDAYQKEYPKLPPRYGKPNPNAQFICAFKLCFNSTLCAKSGCDKAIFPGKCRHVARQVGFIFCKMAEVWNPGHPIFMPPVTPGKYM
jgi:RHS repeat-associated protein